MKARREHNESNNGTVKIALYLSEAEHYQLCKELDIRQPYAFRETIDAILAGIQREGHLEFETSASKAVV
jgi:hypothetical protein